MGTRKDRKKEGKEKKTREEKSKDAKEKKKEKKKERAREPSSSSSASSDRTRPGAPASAASKVEPEELPDYQEEDTEEDEAPPTTPLRAVALREAALREAAEREAAVRHLQAQRDREAAARAKQAQQEREEAQAKKERRPRKSVRRRRPRKSARRRRQGWGNRSHRSRPCRRGTLLRAPLHGRASPEQSGGRKQATHASGAEDRSFPLLKLGVGTEEERNASATELGSVGCGRGRLAWTAARRSGASGWLESCRTAPSRRTSTGQLPAEHRVSICGRGRVWIRPVGEARRRSAGTAPSPAADAAVARAAL